MVSYVHQRVSEFVFGRSIACLGGGGHAANVLSVMQSPAYAF